MDDKKLRLIAAIMIVLIGTAYMTWLVLEYIRSQKLDQHIRRTLETQFAGMREHYAKVVPGDVESSVSDGD